MKREEAKEMFRTDKDSYGKPKAIMHKIDKIFDDFEKDKEKMCILRCKTCEHWKQTTKWDYEGAINSGKCKELPSDQLQIELHTGWDGGYVDYVETEETFGCTELQRMRRKIKDTVFIVWKNDRTGIGERCLMTIEGNFIGIETGALYSKENHYASPLLKGQIVSVDSINKTAMLHLHKEWAGNEEENNATWKKKFIGSIVTLREGHWAGEHKIYYCIELNEYFSDDEVKILQK